MLKRLVSIINIYLGERLIVISSIASVASFILLFANNLLATAFALAIFSAFLLSIIIKLFSVLDKLTNSRTNNGYLNIATYYRYYTSDGKIINMDIQKHIMCKQSVKSNYVHSFYWTGSKPPDLSSETMNFCSFTKSAEGAYDKAHFIFKKPLIYNDVGVAQVNMQLDDSDEKSKTFVSSLVDAPLNLLHFEIILKHKAHQDKVTDARLLKKDTTSEVDLGFKLIRPIPFDRLTSSYECTLYDLDIGFSYKLEWDR